MANEAKRSGLILTVVMIDSEGAINAVVHLGTSRPLQYRTVHIALTDEQVAQLAPRHEYEGRGQCWIEEAHDA